MIEFDFKTADYAVSGLTGLCFNEALRFWKAKFETVKHFKRDVIKHPSLEQLGSFVEEVWEDIQPITVQEAFQEKNMEKRRTMFDCIGVTKLFKALDPELLDKQTISKCRTRWDKNNKPYNYNFDDTYELYKIDGEKLFIPQRESSPSNSVYAVRCWCTTTNREYWIYVPEEAAVGSRQWSSGNTMSNPDAIRAIAWTIRLDISHPKRIYRQGDIIIAEESKESATVTPYHLSKEQYLNLMFSES